LEEQVSGKILRSLGAAAAALRASGLKRPMNFARDGVDAVVMRIGVPPLSAGVDGFRLHGFLRHRSFLAELDSGAYEPITRMIIRTLAREAETFVDGGAHIGLYSVMAVRLAKPESRILSIEPDPYNIRALEYNLRKNRCGRVRVVPAAVADRTGSAPMIIGESTIGSSLVVQRTNIGKAVMRMVPTLTIDSLLADSARGPLLVKLDIEGAEVIALRGMAETAKRIPSIALICEMHPEAMQSGGRKPAELIAIVRDFGMDVFFVSEKEGGLTSADESLWAKGNLFCVRNWSFPPEWILG
jgi:FkbM family methyltransferase